MITEEEARSIAFQVAGYVAGLFMREHPDDVMPTEEIAKGIEEILDQSGVSLTPLDHG